MSFFFGDSFDLYAAGGDAVGYWDGLGFSGGAAPTLVVGRFGNQQLDLVQGQAIQLAFNTGYLKNSGVNEAVHHITFAILQQGAIQAPGTAGYGACFQFSDGANAQCNITVRSDGALLLCAGAQSSSPTVLDTWTGAITLQNQWFVFEIEVVINNTTGSWTIRKNGNTGTADHTQGGLNTRAGTANNYANRLSFAQVQNFTGSYHVIDDLLWRSDPSSVSWLGDIRTYVRMPASDQSVQFTQSGSPTQTLNGAFGAYSPGANTAVYHNFIASFSGTVNSMNVNCASGGGTGNIKFAIYSDNAGVPGTLLGTSSVLTNPPASLNPVTFSPGVTLTAGTIYWIGQCSDSGITIQAGGGPTGQKVYQFAQAYSSWPPASNPTAGQSPAVANPHNFILIYTLSANWQAVSEVHQDGAAGYVFSSTVGQNDLYGIASLVGTPSTVVAVTTRGYAQKSDAGSRQGAVQLKSGAAAPVQSTNGSTLVSGSWAWMWRNDLTDPNTSLAWTAAAVSAVQIGPVVTV